ncbi:MAG TPA: hypothetical protein VF627_15645 [Abditibacterium sp.]|jgi:hypothetical protein
MLYLVFSGPPNPAPRAFRSSNLALIASIVGVLVYTLLTLSGLLGDRIAPQNAYLPLALPCLVPAFWYLIGFLRHEGGDFGLILSSAGWFLAALTLGWKHLSTVAEFSRGVPLDQVSNPPATWIFALASIAAILAGAVQSGRYWVAQNKG